MTDIKRKRVPTCLSHNQWNHWRITWSKFTKPRLWLNKLYDMSIKFIWGGHIQLFFCIQTGRSWPLTMSTPLKYGNSMVDCECICWSKHLTRQQSQQTLKVTCKIKSYQNPRVFCKMLSPISPTSFWKPIEPKLSDTRTLLELTLANWVPASRVLTESWSNGDWVGTNRCWVDSNLIQKF